jgi:hypothetical protein
VNSVNEEPPAYHFDDTSTTAPSRSLFESLRYANTYRLEWIGPGP